MIYSSANEPKLSVETADKLFDRQEEILTHMRYNLSKKSSMLSSEYFQGKFRAQISTYDQSFEQQNSFIK